MSIKEVYKLEQQRDALAEELERVKIDSEHERMRLAACGVAANGGEVDKISPEYKSASLDDVLRLRQQRDDLAKDLKECREQQAHNALCVITLQRKLDIARGILPEEDTLP